MLPIAVRDLLAEAEGSNSGAGASASAPDSTARGVSERLLCGGRGGGSAHRELLTAADAEADAEAAIATAAADDSALRSSTPEPRVPEAGREAASSDAKTENAE